MSEVTSDARVLVIEDDYSERMRLRQALSGVASLQTREDADAALEFMESEGVDVVLFSLELPDRSGLRLLEQLRREHSATDCVALTQQVGSEIVDEALRAGATSVLSRASSVEQLRRVTEQILLRRLLQADNRGLRNRLHSLDASRALLTCLDPGKVYPLALDILLETLSRSRGIALFHRASIQRTDALAFRGFAEGEEGRLRELLSHDKPIDFSRMTAVERTELGRSEGGRGVGVRRRAPLQRGGDGASAARGRARRPGTRELRAL